MMRRAACILLLIACRSWSYAFEASLVGAEVTCRYLEPSRNNDDDPATQADESTPLTDLSHTVVMLEYGAGLKVTLGRVGAESPGGGRSIVTKVRLPDTGIGEEKDFKLYAVACDFSSPPNCSGPSPVTILRVDRLSPAPPQ